MMDGWMNGKVNRWMDKWIMDGWMNGRVNEWMMDGWMNGRVNDGFLLCQGDHFHPTYRQIRVAFTSPHPYQIPPGLEQGLLTAKKAKPLPRTRTWAEM